MVDFGLSKDSLRNIVSLTGEFVGTTDTLTLTNKTISLSSNSLTATSGALGDLIAHDGTSYVRKAKGTANQAYVTNSGATDTGWGTVAVQGGGTGNATFTAGVLASPGGTSALTIKANPTGAFLGDSDTQNITGAKTITHQALKLRNPAGTFTMTVQNPIITADQDFEFPYPTTYIIYISGTTVKAKNGITGAIDYSGDNTIDAVPTIQSAVDNVKNVGVDAGIADQGAIVKILKGSYKCITSLELSASRSGARRAVSLVGEGRGTILDFTPTSALQYGVFIKSDYSGLRDLSIQANANLVALCRVTSSTTHFSDRLLFHNVQFRGTNAWGSLAPTTGQIGIQRDASPVGNIKLYWNRIIACSFDSLDYGIKGSGGANDTSMQIVGCDWYDCTTGIELYAAQHIIDNCWFQGDGSYGVTGIHILGTSSNNIITNIEAELHKTATTSCAVKIDSGSTYNRIHNINNGYEDGVTFFSVIDNSGSKTNIIDPRIYYGLAASTKATGGRIPVGSMFFETDTRQWYYWNGTTWDPSLGTFVDHKIISAPASAAAGFLRVYAKQIDANNDGWFVKVKKAGAVVEVQIA